MKISDIAKINSHIFVHNYFHGKLPKIFNNYFTVFSEVHEINTRGSDNHIRTDIHNTNIGYSTMKIRGAKLWNITSVNFMYFTKDCKIVIEDFRQFVMEVIVDKCKGVYFCYI